MEKKSEPAIVDCGFIPNRWGGWWYRAPSNAYTIQIIPPADKEPRSWMLGIAHRGPMRWGRKSYPSPEAAAFTAFRVTGDALAADRLVEAMTARQGQRMQAIQERIKQLKGDTK